MKNAHRFLPSNRNRMLKNLVPVTLNQARQTSLRNRRIDDGQQTYKVSCNLPKLQNYLKPTLIHIRMHLDRSVIKPSISLLLTGILYAFYISWLHSKCMNVKPP